MSTKLNENTNGLQTVLNDINNFEMPGLNIAYGTTPPSDTSKLWVPLAQKPDNVEISGDSLQSALNTIENMGAVLTNVNSGCMTTAVHGGKIYSFGYNTVDVYDPVTDTVTRKSLTLTNSIGAPAAVSIGDSIYLLGGNSNSYGSNFVHKYNPETNVCTDTGARLPTAIYYAPAVAINGKAYIFGGRTYSYYGTFYNCIQEYDPVTNTCTTKKAVLSGQNCGASATVINGKAYIFGGTNTQNGSASASFNYIQEYDPVTDTCVLSTQNLTDTAWSASSATLNNVIYVLGVGSSRTNIKRFVAKAYLGANNLKLFASIYRSVSNQIITNIVNGKNEQIKLYMTSAFLGDTDGYAKAQDAYVYNTSISNWQTLEGTSL